jgi:hypothetical protein
MAHNVKIQLKPAVFVICELFVHVPGGREGVQSE